MNKTLEALVGELDKLAQQIDTTIPDERSFNAAHNNWSFPGLSKRDLKDWVEDLAQEITDRGGLEVGEHESALSDYLARLKYVRTQAVQNIWGNPPAGVAVVQQTLDGLRILFRRTLPTEPPADAARDIKHLAKRLAAMSARVDALEPRAAGLEEIVGRIEAASEAADALPEDLASLAEARKKIGAALDRANTDASLGTPYGKTQADVVRKALVQAAQRQRKAT